MTPQEFRSFTPLVKACARRHTPGVLPASIDGDDLESVCWQALLEAKRSFQPDRGVPFANWAWLKMAGAVKDEIRRHRFGKRAGERGDVGEPVELDERQANSSPSAADCAEAALELRSVVDAFAALPERERYVLSAKLNGRLDVEIAAELGVTDTRVSQLKSAARGRLRKQVAA